MDGIVDETEKVEMTKKKRLGCENKRKDWVF